MLNYLENVLDPYLILIFFVASLPDIIFPVTFIRCAPGFEATGIRLDRLRFNTEAQEY